MNKVCLIGRLTSDLELRYTNSNTAYTRFNLAVNRNFKDEEGNIQADFISCVAWKERAEMMCKYLRKGSLVAIEGRIQTGSYDDRDGNKRKTTDIIIENIRFLESKEKGRLECYKPTPQEAAKSQNVSPYDFQKKSDVYADFGDSISLDDDFLD